MQTAKLGSHCEKSTSTRATTLRTKYGRWMHCVDNPKVKLRITFRDNRVVYHPLPSLTVLLLWNRWFTKHYRRWFLSIIGMRQYLACAGVPSQRRWWELQLCKSSAYIGTPVNWDTKTWDTQTIKNKDWVKERRENSTMMHPLFDGETLESTQQLKRSSCTN